MKILPVLVLATVSLAVAQAANEVPPEPIPAITPLQEYCMTKWGMVDYIYRNRGTMTKEEMAALFEKDWETLKIHKPEYREHHRYVDMQRIMSDAYRTNGGEYRHVPNGTDEEIEERGKYEAQWCMYSKF